MIHRFNCFSNYFFLPQLSHRLIAGKKSWLQIRHLLQGITADYSAFRNLSILEKYALSLYSGFTELLSPPKEPSSGPLFSPDSLVQESQTLLAHTEASCVPSLLPFDEIVLSPACQNSPTVEESSSSPVLLRSPVSHFELKSPDNPSAVLSHAPAVLSKVDPATSTTALSSLSSSSSSSAVSSSTAVPLLSPAQDSSRLRNSPFVTPRPSAYNTPSQRIPMQSTFIPLLSPACSQLVDPGSALTVDFSSINRYVFWRF